MQCNAMQEHLVELNDMIPRLKPGPNGPHWHRCVKCRGTFDCDEKCISVYYKTLCDDCFKEIK